MIYLWIFLCILNIAILILALGMALAHRKLIDFINRRFYDIELALKKHDDD